MAGMSVHARVLVHRMSVARVRARRMSADPRVLVRQMPVNVQEGVRWEWGVPVVAVAAAEVVAVAVAADGATPTNGPRKPGELCAGRSDHARAYVSNRSVIARYTIANWLAIGACALDSAKRSIWRSAA